jgi:hypothetical protein
MDYTKKDLQIVAAGLVLESEMDNQSVLSLIKFIKNEATDEQLKSIIVTKALPLVVTEAFELAVNEKFELLVAEGKIRTLRKTYMSVSQAGSPAWLAYRKIRSMRDACTKKCGTYEINTVRRQNCYAKCREAAAKAKNDAKGQKKWSARSKDYSDQFKKRGAQE